MSADLQWLLLRKNNSFIVNRTVAGPIFSTEPGNLRNLHSFKYSGLANKKTLDVRSTESGGLTLVTRKENAPAGHQAKAYKTVALKGNSGQRRLAKIIAAETAGKGYRSDLRTSALARASALQAAQAETANPKPVRESKPRHRAAREQAKETEVEESA